jgi:hypothetical protein
LTLLASSLPPRLRMVETPQPSTSLHMSTRVSGSGSWVSNRPRRTLNDCGIQRNTTRV